VQGAKTQPYILRYKLVVRNLASTYSAHTTSRRGVYVGETGGNYAHAHEQYYCLTHITNVLILFFCQYGCVN
jgi:hypothetical protein